MTHFKALKATVCAAAIFSGGLASADVTADQVWEDWKSQFGIYGKDGVTIGSETSSGDTVTVTDLAIEMTEDDTSVSATMAPITFQEQGDGTVQITMSEQFPMVVQSSDGGTIKMSVSHAGLNMIASGTPEALNYDISADRYAFQVDEIEENGAAIESDIRFVANGLTGKFTTSIGDQRNLTYDLATSSVDVFVDVKDPESGGTFLISGKIDAMQANADATLPLDLDMENPDMIFEAGFGMDGSYSFASSSYLFDIQDGPDTVKGDISTGASTVGFGIDNTEMSYDAKVGDLALNLTSADFPFPIAFTTAEYGVGLKVPLAKTEEPADFGLSFDLIDAAVNEEIWMLGDPTGALPHDPATISMDFTGTAMLFFDIMNPEEAEAMEMADVPGEIHSLTLNDLKLAIAGALVTGQGGFTFDNTDFSTVPNFPRPEGDVTFNITGANKLIDSLVSMGLLPEDQAMMGRMMMGMFAQTVGEDELTSKIEINADGHILANGQRIQ